MSEPVIKKRVDESWKEQAEKEKQASPQAAPSGKPQAKAEGQGPVQSPRREEQEGMPEARFDLFVSGLAMEALIALGEMPHPVTRRQSANLQQAKYLIDVLGIIEEKTRGNISVDEGKLLQDALYQLRMRYLSKSSGVATP